jgi:hypothetical protein
MVREALKDVPRNQIDADEVVAVVRSACSNLKAEILRETGRLPA